MKNIYFICGKSASGYMRGYQISEELKKYNFNTYYIIISDINNIIHIKSSIIFIIKKIPKSNILNILKNNNNTLIYDIIDNFNNNDDGFNQNIIINKKYFDYILTVNIYMKQYIEKLLNISHKKVICIYHHWDPRIIKNTDIENNDNENSENNENIDIENSENNENIDIENSENNENIDIENNENSENNENIDIENNDNENIDIENNDIENVNLLFIGNNYIGNCLYLNDINIKIIKKSPIKKYINNNDYLNDCHFNIRDKNNWNFKFKSSIKLSTAAAFNCNIITSYDNSISELLNINYPYIVKNTTKLKNIQKMIKYVNNTYNTTIWHEGLKEMKRIKEITSIEYIIKSYINLINNIK